MPSIRTASLVVVFGLISLASVAQAVPMPACLDKASKPMKIDNARVLRMKATTENQYHDRGFVSGKVDQVYKDQTGHEHFSIRIGVEKKDTLEVVYNQKFGAVPEPRIGMTVVACGDYITSNAPGGGYEASPDDAIIHWVHYNPKPEGHAHGFLIVEDRLVGYKPGWKPTDEQ